MDLLKISSSPHIHTKGSTAHIMLDVIIALIPAGIASVYFFGVRVLWIIFLSVASAVVTEYFIQKLMKKPVTISDLSSVVTGILLAYCLPVTVPWWIPVIGSIIAIALVKQAFGGLGHNFLNPALASVAILLAAWPEELIVVTTSTSDAISSSTPLTILKQGVIEDLPSLLDVFLGDIGGTIGEVSALALVIGAAYLLYRRIISWHIPVSYIATTFVLIAILSNQDLYYAFYQIFIGGLILGAFYMATDYVTVPTTNIGKVIFGVGCGVFTAMLRLYSSHPEGVFYSILLMNITTPLIDKFTQPKLFGEVRGNV